jgi:phage I-like protein
MNPDDLVRLLHNIDLPFGKAPPSEFRIFAAGKIETTKGSFLFDAKAADLVTASAQEWGNEFPVDYDHAMARGGLFVVDPAASGRAAGWFKPEIRNGELWATSVTWTPAASKMLTDREYRYTSPAFRTEEEGGRISELINVALTNLPATRNHTPLMASRAGEPRKESQMKTIAVALSLAAEATEAEVLAAVSTIQGFTARVLSEVGAKTHAEALGILAGWKGNAAQLALLSAKLDEYKAKEVTTEVETLIAEGKAAGKITPSSEPAVRHLAKDHGPAALKGFLAAAQAAPRPLTDPASEGADDLTPQELSAIAHRGPEYVKRIREEKKRAIAAGLYPGAA